MLRGLFRTKESKLILFLCILMIGTVGVLFYRFYTDNKHYNEQTVMAEKYLQEGNYELAIKFFQEALTMRENDREMLSIGLAEAYIGTDNYDMALEALRSSYQTVSSKMIKEKIEDVTMKKNDHEYMEIINQAEKYFINEDYEKSIVEYESAKLIKSKEPLSYQRIAESYIKLEKYALAREEVEEGIAITQNEQLNDIMDTADRFLIIEQYNLIIESAMEYIYQENYEDGIKKYKEAIKVYPQGEEAYVNLVAVYIDQKEYNQGITIANRGLEVIHSEPLEDLLVKAIKSKELEERTKQELTELGSCLDNRDIVKIKNLLSSDFFKNEILPNTPLKYTIKKGNALYDAKELVIYDNGNIYYGHRKEDEKVGNGAYLFMQEKGDIADYFIYVGEWKRNKPTGKGVLEEGTIPLKDNTEIASRSIITEGIYINGIEHGDMNKTFFLDGESEGMISYCSKYGVPLPMEGNDYEEEGDTYPIGKWQHDDGRTEDYVVAKNTYWRINLEKIK